MHGRLTKQPVRPFSPRMWAARAILLTNLTAYATVYGGSAKREQSTGGRVDKVIEAWRWRMA